MTAEAQVAKISRLAALRTALEQGSMRHGHRMVNSLHPAEIASLIESLPPAKREIVWEFVDPELEGDVLIELNEEVRSELIGGMDADELIAATEGMEVDDLADLIGDLPETLNERVLQSMDAQDRERLSAVLAFEEDSAGRLMNLDAVTIRPDVTIETVLRYLRMRAELPERTDRLFVVNRHDRYLGGLDITRLLTEDPESTVGDVMDSTVEGISPETPARDVAKLFEDRDLVSAAVVSADGRLLGRITIDDVVDVIREEADHSVLSMAGLDEDDDMFAGVVRSARRRAVWLGVNLATAFLAANVVGLFEATIEKVVALAVLMPIVASMGGIAGSQTLVLIIRGIALGQVEQANARWLLIREISVGMLNGLFVAGLVGLAAGLWFQEWKVGAIICGALMINLFAAAIVGVSVPLVLKRLGIDPALAGSVVLTTFTDCIGFASLLGLGTLFLT
ncbi:MAG TPA: magnesium transporter [Povalibacter sp.]|uniref:magnesium transporter n=1 Tax=Povalibacter sp. TaxID=1962978 RepID=UPI002CC372D6|nr:magnesium transporter [Povalibacter sp.]HMN45333.1 magnesium transporter [Povalibacter sp.]